MLKYWCVQLMASDNEEDLWTLEFPFYTKDDESPHPHYERLKKEFKERATDELNKENITVDFSGRRAWNTDRKGFEDLGGIILPEDIEEADKTDKEKGEMQL